MIAKAFRVANSAVRVIRGETSREKRLLIEGDATLLTETAKKLFKGD